MSRTLLPPLVLVSIALVACGARPWEVRTYPMGQKVTIGHLTYNVIETQWHPEFGAGPAARAAENQFLLVRLSVTNGGAGDAAVPNLSVEDSRGRAFPELTDGNQVPDWIGALRTLAPADTLTGNAVFDDSAGHYSLDILDEDSQHPARIDLPLSIETEPVEAPGVDLLKTEPASGKK